MMKRLLTIALLVTMFVANPVLAKDWDAAKGYADKIAKLEGDAKNDANKELEAALDAFDALEKANKAVEADKEDKDAKEAQAKAQKAFDAAVAKLDARFPSMLCKVEGMVTWPARKAGELLSSKWGARVATGAGVAAVAYVVYSAVNDNADDEDDVRAWA